LSPRRLSCGLNWLRNALPAKKSFQVGDGVIFPVLGFRLGKVVASRPGQNPEYGAFEVITVDFGSDRRQRNFAAALSAPHKLNAEMPDLLVSGDLASPQRLLSTVATHLPEQFGVQLSQHSGFASFEDRWLLRDQVADVHVGHLNIAEALIEMRQAPVDSDVLLKELDLPAEIGSETALFSLQSALLLANASIKWGGTNPAVGTFADSSLWRRWRSRRLCVSVHYPKKVLLVPGTASDRVGLDDEWSDETPAGAECHPSFSPGSDSAAHLSSCHFRNITAQFP
jgi:hypothetical protein